MKNTVARPMNQKAALAAGRSCAVHSRSYGPAKRISGGMHASNKAPRDRGEVRRRGWEPDVAWLSSCPCPATAWSALPVERKRKPFRKPCANRWKTAAVNAPMPQAKIIKPIWLMVE